jgi:PAS domain S-box-containing protein
VTARFLVVEDDPTYAENLTEILALEGYDSERARNAAEARALAESRPFDVALVDLGLPDARGNDLVADLKTRVPHLLAIVLTGQPTLGSARDAIRSGATAYLLKDGDPRELEVVLRRTAEQAALARALRESEKRYALLVERAPLGIALVRDGKYLFANERFAQIFGTPSAAELVGQSVETVYHPDERDRVREHWRLDRENWEETYTKKGVRRLDGKTIDVLITRARLALEGRVDIQLVVRDVTDENRIARELEEARGQLEEKRRLAALGEMVAGIAHEVRNPLQHVSWGVTELRSVKHEPADVASEALAKIERGMREIDAIVAEVLDYARPMKLERITISAADLLAAARDDLVGPARDAGVSLELDASSARDEISVDALKVKQALVNLVRNAIEASPRGSHVLLRSRVGRGAMRLEVADEGCGLPRDLGDKIYLPFVTTKVKGTGLGLAVVRRIVEAHSGALKLEPREPRGTLAWIEVPS